MTSHQLANLCESIEEGLGQPLATATLHLRILTREYASLFVLHTETAIKLGHVHLSTMIQTCIESFQNRL